MFSKKLLFLLCISLITCQEQIKIMCIGDSITDGIGGAGSYRKFLYNDLRKKGYNINMVGAKGSKSANYKDKSSGESFDYDDENTGYSGYTITAFGGRSGILETIKSTGCLKQAPDIATVHIGTNDLSLNRQESDYIKALNQLTDYILENIPETSTLFLCSIIYFKGNNGPQNTDVIDKYNANIKKIVEERADDRLKFIDLNKSLNDYPSQLGDIFHPNDKGYKAMGLYLSDELDKFLKSKK